MRIRVSSRPWLVAALIVLLSAPALGGGAAAEVRTPRDSPGFAHGRSVSPSTGTPSGGATTLPRQSVPRVPADSPLVPDPGYRPIWVPGVGPGQYVKPDTPDPLFTIADLSTMWLLANVNEADIGLIQLGQRVEVHVMAYPNETFRARITNIGAAVDPATHRITVRAEAANPGRKLKAEMFASFRILTSTAVTAPAVPVSAVVRDGDAATVWVASGPKQFTRRRVTLGLEQDGLLQVVSGVQPGEIIATEGALLLSNTGRSSSG